VTMAELEEAMRLIAARPDQSDFVGPRDELVVDAAEEALGFAFPPTYRRFLRELGAGSFDGAEFYGVLGSDFEHSGIPDGVWISLRHRREGYLPRSLAYVYNFGTGEMAALDASRRQASEELPVVAWEPGVSAPDGDPELLAPDFGAFFLEQVKVALRDLDANEPRERGERGDTG
jgi:hypothetical protein